MKERLDILMVQRGLAATREKARACIMAGDVSVDGRKADKAGQPVAENAEITVREDALPFVSRGGLKLQKAVEVFPIELAGVVALDIGASTGGFSDCMLQHGAAHVYAIDVGYGQLDWKLRNDPRVTVMERTNARFMEPAWFLQTPTFASIDVSFISLRIILPPLLQCLAEGANVVALIKPQFEAGRSEVGKNGVVRDPDVHTDVCRRIVLFARDAGYCIRGLSFSPITGPKGNIEFLLHLSKPSLLTADTCTPFEPDIQDVVSRAHTECI